jgi:hypothetical protein
MPRDKIGGKSVTLSFKLSRHTGADFVINLRRFVPTRQESLP